VLVFEDLHWADDGLLDFVDHLADWATTVPILIVGTARPELLDRRPSWSGGAPTTTSRTRTSTSRGWSGSRAGVVLARASPKRSSRPPVPCPWFAPLERT